MKIFLVKLFYFSSISQCNNLISQFFSISKIHILGWLRSYWVYFWSILVDFLSILVNILKNKGHPKIHLAMKWKRISGSQVASLKGKCFFAGITRFYGRVKVVRLKARKPLIQHHWQGLPPDIVQNPKLKAPRRATERKLPTVQPPLTPTLTPLSTSTERRPAFPRVCGSTQRLTRTNLPGRSYFVKGRGLDWRRNRII